MRLAWAGTRVVDLRLAPVALAVVVLASGCQVLGIGASGGTPARGPITVAVVPGIDNAPLSIAVRDGLFRQHGLDVPDDPDLGRPAH